VVGGEPPLYCKNPGAQARWATRIAGLEPLRGWPAPART
jgi:hypothetical protein